MLDLDKWFDRLVKAKMVLGAISAAGIAIGLGLIRTATIVSSDTFLVAAVGYTGLAVLIAGCVGLIAEIVYHIRDRGLQRPTRIEGERAD